MTTTAHDTSTPTPDLGWLTTRSIATILGLLLMVGIGTVVWAFDAQETAVRLLIIPATATIIGTLIAIQLQSAVVLLRDDEYGPLLLCVILSPLALVTTYTAAVLPTTGLLLGTPTALVATLFALSLPPRQQTAPSTK